jgi:hypothetical protein
VRATAVRVVTYPRWNDYLFCATVLALVTTTVLALTGHRDASLGTAVAAIWFSMWRTEKQRDHLEKLLREREHS